MRRLCASIALVVLLVTAGCATGRGAGTSNPSGGTASARDVELTGMVTAAPGCPGPQRAESACPDRPVPGARVDLASGGSTVASTSTDGAGRFRFVVPPADYRITAHNVGYASQATKDVSVTGPLDVTLVVDSGLR